MSGPGRPAPALVAAAAIAAAALAGCGFQPLYATSGVASGLSHVQVIAPEGRVGYLLREDLDDTLGKDKGARPLYRLEMHYDQRRSAYGLTVAGYAQRYELDMVVSYTLTALATGAIAHAGSVVSSVSYDSTDQPYAGIAARQDTQERLAADAARQIGLDLEAWMARAATGRSGPKP
ncbi:MAG TPA: LPS assembly lipoprotein LptE [Caulobacteraceae bacterium]|nr:LPS assembly lipoprotein LptE [Caulobacteraceae bacterium]